MKKVLLIILAVVAGFFAMILINPELLAYLIMTAVVLAIIFGVYLVIKMLNNLKNKYLPKKDEVNFEPKYSTQKDKVSSKPKYIPLIAILNHAVGLPVAENLSCTLKYMEDCIKIEVGTTEFNLNLNKIIDMTITSDVEIQNHYSSSIGGAVGGAILFGPLGAMVGGRSKKKQSKVTTYFFVITYNSNNEVKYISFYVGSSFLAVNKFIKRFGKSDIKCESHKVDL